MVWLVEETKRSPETEKFPRSPRRFRTTTFERHVSDAIISRFPNPTTGFPHDRQLRLFLEVRVGNFPARFLSLRRLGARLSWYWLRSRPWEVAASGSNPTYLQKTLPGTPAFHFLMSVYNTEAIVASGVLPGRFTKYPMRTAVLKEKEEGKYVSVSALGLVGRKGTARLGGCAVRWVASGAVETRVSRGTRVAIVRTRRNKNRACRVSTRSGNPRPGPDASREWSRDALEDLQTH